MISLPQLFHSPPSSSQESHDSTLLIKNSYNEISQIVSNSQAVFQKLYIKKEFLLAQFLEQSLERMTKQLETYGEMTNGDNIEKLCEVRRQQLESERMVFLKQFLKISETNLSKKNKSNKLKEQLAEMNDELKRMEEISEYLTRQNETLKPHLQKLSLRESHEFFPTQPVPYISPYSTQSEYLQGGKKKKIMSSKIGRGKKNDLAYSPFFSKLSESKHISNDLEITESVLNMPEVRMLMVRILERKKEG